MKNSIFIFSLLLGLLLISWDSEADNYKYKKYWQQSNCVKSDAKSSFKILQKENLTLPKVIIATVTVTKSNKESESAILVYVSK